MRFVHRRRRGFTLFEAMAVVVVLAIATPTALSMLMTGASARIDAAHVSRATWFATGALEQVLADVHSDAAGLGFDALADAPTYLNTPGTGLYARLDHLISHYTPMGLTLGVNIGGLVAYDGVATGNPDDDVYRYITASVSWTDASGDPRTMSVSAMVTDL